MYTKFNFFCRFGMKKFRKKMGEFPREVTYFIFKYVRRPSIFFGPASQVEAAVSLMMWKQGLKRGDMRTMKCCIYKIHCVISAKVNHYGIRKILRDTESDILCKGRLDLPNDILKITNVFKARFLPSYIMSK